MDSWVRFNAHSQAKERLIRAAQYSCALLGSALPQDDAASSLSRTISDLEAQMSLSRKLLRLGNSLEALEAAKRSVHVSDGVLRLCLTISHLNRAMYFLCDNVLWVGKSGLLTTLDTHRWSQRAFRFYLFSLILNLTRDVYELCLLIEGEARHRASKGQLLNAEAPPPSSSVPAVLHRKLRLLSSVLYANPPLLMDLMKNSCDIFIPLSTLGIYPRGRGFVGACGLASSLLSILTIIHPWLKLKP